MKKLCIFRCQFGGKRYSIYVSPHPKREGEMIYWTYEGRRLFDHYHWDSFEGAVGSILLANSSFHLSDFGKIWI